MAEITIYTGEEEDRTLGWIFLLKPDETVTKICVSVAVPDSDDQDLAMFLVKKELSRKLNEIPDPLSITLLTYSDLKKYSHLSNVREWLKEERDDKPKKDPPVRQTSQTTGGRKR